MTALKHYAFCISVVCGGFLFVGGVLSFIFQTWDFAAGLGCLGLLISQFVWLTTFGDACSRDAPVRRY